jgi:Phytanoyl-CoA dioxygenase (PhyH)
MQARSLSETEVSTFRTRGWAYLPRLIDPEIATRLHDSACQLSRDGRDIRGFGERANRAFRAYPDDGARGGFAEGVILSAVMGVNVARLLNVSRVRFLSGGFLRKPPAGDEAGPTPYHQDFPGHAFDRSTFLTFWIALQDLPADSGTLRFFERSHERGVLGNIFADGTDLPSRCLELKNEDLSGPLSLRAGDATVHHALTVHGAPANQTATDRWGYSFIYFDADALYTGGVEVFPEGVALRPMQPFDHPAFPLISVP